MRLSWHARVFVLIVSQAEFSPSENVIRQRCANENTCPTHQNARATAERGGCGWWFRWSELDPALARRPSQHRPRLICGIGTTIQKAGSKDAFARVDRDSPCGAVKRHDTRLCPHLGMACGGPPHRQHLDDCRWSPAQHEARAPAGTCTSGPPRNLVPLHGTKGSRWSFARNYLANGLSPGCAERSSRRSRRGHFALRHDCR
jgi:hypothetical protein